MPRIKKLWPVICPMCRCEWNYRDDHIFVPPKRKYCKKCKKIVDSIGRASVYFRIGE